MSNMKKINENYEEPRFSDVLWEVNEDEFQIGQGYEDKPARKLVCKKCGSQEFIVGSGSYYTAIKCPKCKWEMCIHDG